MQVMQARIEAHTRRASWSPCTALWQSPFSPPKPLFSPLQAQEAEAALVQLVAERNAVVGEKDAAVRRTVELQVGSLGLSSPAGPCL